MKLSIVALFGATFLFLGVLLGALGSHFLTEKISPESLQSFRIATRYMLIHGLALLFLPVIPYLTDPQKLNAGLYLLIGTGLFSLSIFGVVYQKVAWNFGFLFRANNPHWRSLSFSRLGVRYPPTYQVSIG